MRHQLGQLLAITILVAAPTAFGASLHLVPLQTTDVQPGQEIGFELVFDFNSVYDSGYFALGGGFDVVYDPTALSFSGISAQIVGDPDFYREPEIQPGLLESWAGGDFAGLPRNGSFGFVYFTVLAGLEDSTSVSVQDTTGIGGPWLCDGVSLCIIDMDYNTVTLSRVPLPGAFVCLLGALVALRQAGRAV